MNLSTVFMFQGLTLLCVISIIFDNLTVEGVLRCLAVEKENDIKIATHKRKKKLRKNRT